MNKERRKDINQISQELRLIKRRLGFILDDESDAFDNMPEGLQSSIRGQESEESIDIMQNAMDVIDDVIEILSEIN